MVKGWHIESEDIDEIIDIAKDIALHEKDWLKQVALLLGSPKICEECDTTIDDMVACYNDVPTSDLTCYVFKETEDGLGHTIPRQLVQLASGGGECRDMKEKLRIAMCALIMARHEGSLQIHVG